MVNQYCADSFARNWQLPFLNQQKGENDCRKYFMINLHERMLPTWSPVGRRIQLSHRYILGTMKICWRYGLFEPLRVNHCTKSETKGDYLGKSFLFYTIMVCWVYSLELPWWGNSNEYTQHTISCWNKIIFLNMCFLEQLEEIGRAQKWIQISHGKWAISVWAI